MSAASVQFPILSSLPLVTTLASGVAASLAETNVALTTLTLSGLPSATPIDVVAFDSKAAIKHIFIDSGLPVIGFEPATYLDNLSAPSAVHDNQLRYPLPSAHRQPWISTEDQAALAVAALGRPDLAGKWFRIGEKYTGAELAAGIGSGLDREIRYVPIDPNDFGRLLVPALGVDAATAIAEDYATLRTRPPALDLDADTATVRRELGVPATSLAVWTRRQDWLSAAPIGS